MVGVTSKIISRPLNWYILGSFYLGSVIQSKVDHICRGCSVESENLRTKVEVHLFSISHFFGFPLALMDLRDKENEIERYMREKEEARARRRVLCFPPYRPMYHRCYTLAKLRVEVKKKSSCSYFWLWIRSDKVVYKLVWREYHVWEVWRSTLWVVHVLVVKSICSCLICYNDVYWVSYLVCLECLYVENDYMP